MQNTLGSLKLKELSIRWLFTFDVTSNSIELYYICFNKNSTYLCSCFIVAKAFSSHAANSSAADLRTFMASSDMTATLRKNTAHSFPLNNKV